MERPPNRDQFSADVGAGFDAMAGTTARLLSAAFRILKWFVIGLVVVSVVYYGGEDIALRLHLPKSHEPLTSMEVTRYLAIHKKNGKIEYATDAPTTEVCVNALLPHFGFTPCWYLRRESNKRVDM